MQLLLTLRRSSQFIMVELHSRGGVTATAITPPLPQVVGYIVVVVVGLIIALGISPYRFQCHEGIYLIMAVSLQP